MTQKLSLFKQRFATFNLYFFLFFLPKIWKEPTKYNEFLIVQHKLAQVNWKQKQTQLSTFVYIKQGEPPTNLMCESWGMFLSLPIILQKKIW